MKIDNTKSQMRKGILEYCILNILYKKEAYPSDIVKSLKDAKMSVVEGTIYPLLTRLKNANYLTYRWEESKSGPPRKYYEITKEGEVFLGQLEETWHEIQNAVNELSLKKK
jgi:PadR family transcriptional regulator, regulatory protein PadR